MYFARVNRGCLKSNIAERLPGKRISYIWNNIVKAEYRREGGGYGVPANVYAKFRDANRRLILGELDIVKPDVIIFFTGSGYDAKIEDIFNGGVGFNKQEVDVDGNRNALAVMSLPAYPCCGTAIVTYHPIGLITQGVIAPVLDKITERCEEAARQKGLL